MNGGVCARPTRPTRNISQITQANMHAARAEQSNARKFRGGVEGSGRQKCCVYFYLSSQFSSRKSAQRSTRARVRPKTLPDMPETTE